jgi:hypothetical protein
MTLLTPGMAYVDGLFIAMSALTGTGFSTVESRAISMGGFVTIYILMYLGGTCTLLLPPIIYRRIAYGRIRPQLQEFLLWEATQDILLSNDSIHGQAPRVRDRPMARALINAINHSELLYRGLGMSLIAVALHNFFWLFVGTFIMYGVSQLYAEPQVSGEHTLCPD